jgi:membrane dipeptidase
MLIKGADFSGRVPQGYTPGKFPLTQVDFPRMRKGGVDASFFAVYTSNSLLPDAATRRALEMVAAIFDAVEHASDVAAIALSPEEAYENKKKGLISIYLGMENGAPIQKSLSLLRLFYRLGIRYMTLTHCGNNEICDSSSAPEKRWGGLSPFGRKVIAEMNRLGMLIDVSHISDESFWDCIRYSEAPLVATHSCCRAIANVPRNMSDEMIRAVAENGGVVQINFYPFFLDDTFTSEEKALTDRFDDADYAWRDNPSSPDLQKTLAQAAEKQAGIRRVSYKRVVDHIDHAVEIAGVDHVGIGSDFDGINVTPEGLEDISMLPVLTEEMIRRGYSEQSIRKILGENFLNVMKKARDVAEGR